MNYTISIRLYIICTEAPLSMHRDEVFISATLIQNNIVL